MVKSGKEKSGKTTAAATRIRRRYTKWQEDNKKDTSQEAFSKYSAGLAKKLAGMSAKDREDFLMKMAHHQLTRTHNDFTDLFFEKPGLFGIRRRTVRIGKQRSITRGQQKELKPIRQAQKQREKELAASNRPERFSRIRLLVQRFIPQPAYTEEEWANNEYPNERQSQQNTQSSGFNAIDMMNRGMNMYDTAKQGRSLFNMIRGFGGAGGGAAGGAEGATAAAAGTSEFWGPVLLAILVAIIIIVLLILLFVVLFSTSSQTSTQVVQESCGDFSDSIDVSDFTDKFAGLQQELFHIGDPGGNYRLNPDGSPNSHFQDAVNAYKLFFNTYCLYYGHADGKLEGKDNFNTFAKLLLGDRFVQKDGKWIYVDGKENMGTGNEKAKFITNFVAFDDGINGCAAQFQPNAGGGKIISTIFVNPNKCDVAQMQFLIGQSLAHTLIAQADATGKSDVFDLFQGKIIGTKGITDLDGFLPTFGCVNKSGNDLVYGSLDGVVHQNVGLGELQPNQQQRNCFADMVGEYLTYPYYTNDSRIPLSYQYTSPVTNTPTNTVTPTDTQTFLAPPKSVLENFPSGEFADYYNFARDNLFDGESFIVSLKAATCPDTLSATGDVTQLTDGLKKYGFIVTGNITKEKLSQTYETVCLLMQSDRYRSLLKADKTPVTLNFSDSQNCCGFTHGDTIELYGWHSNDLNRFGLVHELTHELVHNNRSPNIYSLYYNNVYTKTAPLPTYNCQHDYDNNYCDAEGNVCGTTRSGECKNKCHGPYEGECIADGVGLYLTYPTFNDIFNGPDAGKGMPDYPSGPYSKYYDFAYNEIFGATVFNGGNATEGSGFASSLVDRFKANPACFHDTSGRGWAYLNKSDVGCVGKLSPALPTTQSSDGQTAANALTNSVAQNGILECVGFVKSVAAGIGKAFLHHGDARTYATDIPPGYRFIKNTGGTLDIKSGDVAVWDYPGGQHIADVISVIPNKQSNDGSFHTVIKVAEGNGDYCTGSGGAKQGGCVDKANYVVNNDIVGWLRPL